MKSSQSHLIRGKIKLGIDDRKITAGRPNMTCTGQETTGQREENQDAFRN